MSSRLITSSIRSSRCLLKASQLNKCSIHTTRTNYFFNFFKKKEVKKVEPDNRVLQPDNLFHPWSKSPFQDLVDRDKMIKDYGNCPVCVEHGEHSHTQPKLTYECPDCGFTTHCSEAHYKADIEKHKEVCGQLKEINEDEHDLRSQRAFPEFQFPKTQLPDSVVNFTNWDTFFITRNFNNIEDDRAMRHVTKPLSYPLTIASVLHQYSPYLLDKGLTYEGVKSLSAIKYTIESSGQVNSNNQRVIEQIRIFVLGARAESQLPPQIYQQINYLFPETPFHIHFIGPEAIDSQGQSGKFPITGLLTLSFHNEKFHDFYDKFVPFDPYRDVFFLFSPGIGYHSEKANWKPTIDLLLETKCPVIITSYNQQDQDADVRTLNENHGSEMDWLMPPQLNKFRSMKLDYNLEDLTSVIQSNHGIMGIRGKRYEVTRS